MKLSLLRAHCAESLSAGGIERPGYTADIIISRELGLKRESFITDKDKDIPARHCAGILSMVERRLRREPLSYILGEAEFYGHVFKVGPGCLIPRPETELLVEELLRYCPKGGKTADWCTGSGCIGITMLLENPTLTCRGVDSSAEALRWAGANRARYGLEERFDLVRCSDAAECGIEQESLDVIAANPPYIPTCEVCGLMKDVSSFEPREALDGGTTGTDIYAMLFATLPGLLKRGGVMGYETGGGAQADSLIRMAPQSLELIGKIQDYSGILRHLIWKKI